MKRTSPDRTFAARERLRQSLWFLPALLVFAAAGLAVVLVLVDHKVMEAADSRLLFRGGADGARELVSTVAGSMVAFIGTVFSITVIVLQLASSQFSPRALRTFLRDRRSQLPLGIFLGTLVYALVVLWTIRSGGNGSSEFVPHLAITGAYVMVLLSLGTFVYFIHHVSQSIRVANVVQRIGAETVEILDKRYPEPFDPDLQTVAPRELCGVGVEVRGESYGVLLAVDQERLARRAEELGGRIEVLPYVGEFLPIGAPWARWSGSDGAADSLEVARYMTLGHERTMEQDLAFGIRQLVDIAEKALSPGVNDPTTASQALDQIHNVLRQLAHRSFPHEVRRDDEGAVRLITHERNWNDIVQLAFDEIRQYGTDSIQVRSRLLAVLDDLLSSVPVERREPIERQLDALPREADTRPR